MPQSRKDLGPFAVWGQYDGRTFGAALRLALALSRGGLLTDTKPEQDATVRRVDANAAQMLESPSRARGDGELLPGDVLYVIRTLGPQDLEALRTRLVATGAVIGSVLTYRHYGIADGNDGVVHFVGATGLFGGDIRIRHTSIATFAQSDQVQIDDYVTALGAFPRDQILQRAIDKVGSSFGGYNLLTNNCEHFASWAATGKRISRQASLVMGGSPDQDVVSNMIDRAAAATDKFFDPLIAWGDRVDRLFGWGRHRKR